MHIDLSGRGAIALTTPDPNAARYLSSAFTPFRADTGPPSAPMVTLVGSPAGSVRLDELQRAADDDLVTGTDGHRAYVIWDGRACSIPDATTTRPAEFAYELGFPLWRVFRTAIRPALQVALAADGRAVALHAASVVRDGRAIAVAGWSESGKTETALALMERGASFLSDKWTLLGPDREMSAFPISIGVRRWVLPYLPTLRRTVTRRSQVQFAAAGAASVVLDPVGRRPAPTRSRGMIADLARRTGAIGDRAAFEVDELRAAYGDTSDPTRRVPTRAVCLLVNAPDGARPHVEPMDPDLAALRLARTAGFERRSYFALRQRAAYLLADQRTTITDAAVEADAAILRSVLTGVTVLGVRAPFPTDPNTVAEAILRALD
ncbi:MAG: hypothetical protein ABWY52_04415 [Candidatus Limnocylindrales bacterium]